MYCENCGAKIDKDSRFCEVCGARIEPEAKADSFFSEPEEDLQPVTDIKDLMELDDSFDFEASVLPKYRTGSTMIFEKKENIPVQETKRIEFAHQWDPEPFKEPEMENNEPEPEPEELSEPEPETIPEPETQSDLEPVSEQEKEPEPEPAAEPVIETFSVLEQEPIEDPVFEADADENPQETAWAPEPAAEPEIQGDPEDNPELEKEQDEEADDELLPILPSPEEKGARQLYCMACGKKLPEGAAFCDACGTPTGEVSPAEIHKRRRGESLIPELIKHIFVKPASVIEKAASEDAFSAGLGFFIVKDVLLSILSAVFMKKLVSAAGLTGTWMAGGDPFGFGTKIFLCGIVLDALWIGILYGMGNLFKSKTSVKEVIGATGTASLFSAVLMIITIILAAFLPSAAVCALLVTAAAAVIFMTKAVSVSFDMSEDKTIYLTAASAACYLIILYIGIKLIIL